MYEALGLVPGTLIAKHYANILDALVEKESLHGEADGLFAKISCAIMNNADHDGDASLENDYYRELDGVSHKIDEADNRVIHEIISIARLILDKEHPTSGGDAFLENIAWVTQEDPMRRVCSFILGKAYELGLHDPWLMDRARMNLLHLMDSRDLGEED